MWIINRCLDVFSVFKAIHCHPGDAVLLAHYFLVCGSAGSDGGVYCRVMCWDVPAAGSLQRGEPGLDVGDLLGNVSLVKHDHGLAVHIGCEAGDSLILLSDGHDLEACWNDEGFERFSTAKGGV